MLKYLVMTRPSDYRNAYKAAQRELTELLSQQEKLEKRIIAVRKTIQGLTEICETEDVRIDRSPEAEHLLATSKLTDEVFSILKAEAPAYLRPADIRIQLEHLGHNLKSYQNPLATIHMVLKRLVEAERVSEITSDGKKMYRAASVAPIRHNMAEFIRSRIGSTVRDELKINKRK